LNCKNKQMKKPIPGLLLLLALIGLAGCYNNAHLRTQQLLEPGEKVVSGSEALPLGGRMEYGLLDRTGVSGLRGEVSFLTGKRWGESGPYVGLGLAGDEEVDIIAGYEIKRYIKLNTAQPWKLGLQAEGNLNLVGEYGSPGFALHLRPSFTSTTTRKRPYYGGLHGLVSLGSLEKPVSFKEYADEGRWIPEEYVGYQFYSYGAGVTAGYEKISRTASTQMQVDASWVYGRYLTREYTPDNSFPSSSRSPSSSTFIVTGSVGLNLFRPEPSARRPAGPLPAPPVPPKEMLEATAPAEHEPQFDPETGELIPPHTPLKGPLAAGEVGLEAAPENVIAAAEAEAVRSHNVVKHQIAGAAGCLFGWIGLPITTMYVESGVPPGVDKNSTSSAAAYYRGLSPEQQLVYEQTYQNKVKSLRRRSVYVTQLSCFGAIIGFILIMGL